MTNTEAPLDKNISIKSQMFREFNMSFDKKKYYISIKKGVCEAQRRINPF